MSSIVPLALGAYIQFILDNASSLFQLTIEHIVIITQAIAVAVPLGVVLGTLITFNDRVATVVLWLTGVMMTIPSIALFGLLIPYFGIGNPPVIVALILYSQLPVVRNTYVGLTEVNPAAVEAGEGLGMTQVERLRRVKIPMALPVVMAGIRNAVVVLIGIAAIGAYIGAGGLGDFIFDGISDADTPKIVVTTVCLSLLALTFDYGFASIEQRLRRRNGESVDPLLFQRVVNKVKA